jgi:hypothetical protein
VAGELVAENAGAAVNEAARMAPETNNFIVVTSRMDITEHAMGRGNSTRMATAVGILPPRAISGG